MLRLSAIWPPYGVRVTEGDLMLTVISEADIPGLVQLALDGVHPADQMPFSTPWTSVDRADLPANMVRYFAGVVAGFTPERFTLLCAVRVGGELVGVQGFVAEDFAVTRAGETGSWLGQRFQRRGIGTRMRRAICTLAFDGLGAEEVTSGAFSDNPASLRVSRKVGYQPNGVLRVKRGEAEVARNQKLVLTPQTFVGGASVALVGMAELRAFLRLA